MPLIFGRSLWFSRRISNLNRRVKKIKNLSRKSSHEKIKDLEDELNTCLASLELLIDYAENHRVGTQRDYNLVEQIDHDINEAEQILQAKTSFWRRVLNIFMKLLPFVRQLLMLLVPLVLQTNPVLAASITGFVLISSRFEAVGLLPPAPETPPLES